MKVLYFSNVNWNWIKQRPHFLSYYISKYGIDVDYFSITPIFKQKKSCYKKINERLTIKDKYVLPFASKFRAIQILNNSYIRLNLMKDYDVIILTHPNQYMCIPNKYRNKIKIIYECMDNIPFFYKDKMRRIIMDKEEELCRKCDKIIVSSQYLKRKIVIDYVIQEDKIEVIENAVDYSIIKQEVRDLDICHPNLMYIGTIDDWIDIDTLNEFSANNLEYKIYLVGPIKKEIKQKLKYNVKLMDSIPHEMVKSYILKGDVMIIPFKTNELINGVDPVKMYEYLTFNKPVITSYWSELDKYCSNELVYFYNNYNEFNKKIKVAEKHRDTHINMDFITENNWETRIKRYVSILNSI